MENGDSSGQEDSVEEMSLELASLYYGLDQDELYLMLSAYEAHLGRSLSRRVVRIGTTTFETYYRKIDIDGAKALSAARSLGFEG